MIASLAIRALYQRSIVAKRASIGASLAASLNLGLVTPLLADQSPTNAEGAVAHTTIVAPKKAIARKCLDDLRAFDDQLRKDGYWLHGSGYGYGYPIDGFGPSNGGQPSAGGKLQPASSRPTRPGYEVRTLIATADILALHDQQQACESLLAVSRDVYQGYLAHLRNESVTQADVPSWRRRLIADARPVTDSVSLSPTEMIGVEVINFQNEELGSVDDAIVNPQTGKLAYLVIAREGVFGVNEKYVPVPWGDFELTTGNVMLVLDASRARMAAAPQLREDVFDSQVAFGPQREKVAAYWRASF